MWNPLTETVGLSTNFRLTNRGELCRLTVLSGHWAAWAEFRAVEPSPRRVPKWGLCLAHPPPLDARPGERIWKWRSRPRMCARGKPTAQSRSKQNGVPMGSLLGWGGSKTTQETGTALSTNPPVHNDHGFDACAAGSGKCVGSDLCHQATK